VWSQIFGSGESRSVAVRAIPRRSRLSWSASWSHRAARRGLYSCFSESIASSPIETPRAVAISRTVAQVGLAKPPRSPKGCSASSWRRRPGFPGSCRAFPAARELRRRWLAEVGQSVSFDSAQSQKRGQYITAQCQGIYPLLASPGHKWGRASGVAGPVATGSVDTRPTSACPSGVRSIAISARTSSSPMMRPTQSSSTWPSPSSSSPS
jgi:hypothetical protein